jgi:hypothetical protein
LQGKPLLQQRKEVRRKPDVPSSPVAWWRHTPQLCRGVELHFELERSGLVSAREWHEEAGIERHSSGRLNFALKEVDRLSPVDWQHVTRETSDVHAARSVEKYVVHGRDERGTRREAFNVPGSGI